MNVYEKKTVKDLIQETLIDIPPPLQHLIIGYTLPRVPIGKFNIGFTVHYIASSDQYLFLAGFLNLKVFSLDGNFTLLKEFHWYRHDDDDGRNSEIDTIMASNERLILVHMNGYGVSFIDLTQPIETWKIMDKWYYWSARELVPEIKDQREQKNSPVFMPAECEIIDNIIFAKSMYITEHDIILPWNLDTDQKITEFDKNPVSDLRSKKQTNLPIELTNLSEDPSHIPSVNYTHYVHENHIISAEWRILGDVVPKNKQYQLIFWDILKQQIVQIFMFPRGIQSCFVIDTHIIIGFNDYPYIYVIDISN